MRNCRAEVLVSTPTAAHVKTETTQTVWLAEMDVYFQLIKELEEVKCFFLLSEEKQNFYKFVTKTPPVWQMVQVPTISNQDIPSPPVQPLRATRFSLSCLFCPQKVLSSSRSYLTIYSFFLEQLNIWSCFLTASVSPLSAEQCTAATFLNKHGNQVWNNPTKIATYPCETLVVVTGRLCTELVLKGKFFHQTTMPMKNNFCNSDEV